MARSKQRTPAPRRRSAADVATGADAADGDSTVLRGNDDTATRAWKCWRESRNHLSKWRAEAAESYDFVAGRQWTAEEEASLKEQLRPVVTFNRTDVVLNSVSGYEINSRQDVTYRPRENSDTGAVEVEGAAAKWARDNCDAEDEESDAFFDTLVCGLGTIEHRIDYDDEPDGELRVDRVDSLEMGYDPAAAKRNLVDRRWDVRGKWWDTDEAKNTFPDFKFDMTANVAGDASDLDERDPIDREAARRYEDNGAVAEYDRHRGKIFILEYTWFERESYVRALNPVSGAIEETTAKVVKELNERLAIEGQPPIKSVRSTRKVFKRAFVYGPDTINKNDLDAPCKERFHYQFLTGKRDRNKNIWYGLVRPMKDPQAWANKFLSQLMHIINANAKGGVMSEEGALEDDANIEQKLAKPGWHIVTKQGKLDKVRFVAPTPIPNNTFELTQFSIGSVRDTTGVNVELLGLADRDQPGVLEQSRKQSAMAILAPFFNAMRRYRKEAGRLTLYFNREYLSDGRLIRIVGKAGERWVPLTKQEGFEKYDVVVDQSPTSPNGKELVFAILMQIVPMMIQRGMPVPPEVLDYIPNLPAELAESWKKSLQTGPTPEAQKALQIEQDNKIADTTKKTADAELARAKAGDAQADMMATLSQLVQGVAQLQAMFGAQQQPAAPPMPPTAPPTAPPIAPQPQLPAPMPMQQ